jgi:hypothetical protein
MSKSAFISPDPRWRIVVERRFLGDSKDVAASERPQHLDSQIFALERCLTYLRFIVSALLTRRGRTETRSKMGYETLLSECASSMADIR